MVFKFSDTAPLGDNFAAYSAELEQLDSTLRPVLATRLNDLAAGAEPALIWDELLAALAKTPKAP
ncbi:hypothetical protein G6321_00001905 (plasmid) [Bradyrhizobium barranii subsp. barranii]|uniref:Uncharacterized protein n=1 Tax=Bradyrhizobium barranii subsp. barranii TaxID=2823807 RepID=A0A7Z0QLK2_9BRAD|nr:hypothetical protein [Bradyrhizobium barranii]UGX89545.1 hypothetical protein G6321_00001905 [Bradyrhizobium barranii subsp. barranii]